jgi:hypothetical protein
MQQMEQKNVKTWSCRHQTYLLADLSYEVTQERGYSVARLRSTKLLDSASSTITSEPLAPTKKRAKIIEFRPRPVSKPKGAEDDLRAMMTTWIGLAATP